MPFSGGAVPTATADAVDGVAFDGSGGEGGGGWWGGRGADAFRLHARLHAKPRDRQMQAKSEGSQSQEDNNMINVIREGRQHLA